MRAFASVPCVSAQKNRVGFTLVEVMVVTFLLVVLSSYSFISARALLQRIGLDRASSRLAFQLQQARSEAISTNQNVFVALQADQNRFASWVEPGSDGNTIPDDVDFVEIGDPTQVTISSEWSRGLFNAHGQFITTPGQREMKTVATRFTSQSNERSIELILRGSGAITKR